MQVRENKNAASDIITLQLNSTCSAGTYHYSITKYRAAGSYKTAQKVE